MNDLKGKRVLITGAAGFIGSNLARKLLETGAEVHGIVRESTDLWRLAGIDSSLALHETDLQDFKKVKKIITKVNPQLVFNAAMPHGHPKLEQQKDYLTNSLLSTANILEALSATEYDCLIHLGSSLEYSSDNKPFKESDRTEPTTFRGVTKTATSLLCEHYIKSRNNPIVILRLFSVYGYFEHFSRLIPTAIKATLSNKTMDLTKLGYSRDLIFIDDVVEACLVASQTKKAIGETINVGSGKQWKNEEVIDQIQAVLGQKIKVNIGSYPKSPSDKSYWAADTAKAKRLLRWEPRYSLQEGLKKTVAWFEKYQGV
ncbi:MAG: NAD(P)-dependent oxidoreductase [Actinobacteria bacterium]|nr:MAG: NAD(P)-dependent oxidoreductase [Actinomycetota bacterium]